MILGIGVDICQISRIKLEQEKRILSDEERNDFNVLKLEARKQSFLAGRFAIKEALIKAFSQAGYCFLLRDLVIENDELGRPKLIKPLLEGLKIHLSITHEISYSVGLAVIEKI